MSICYEQAESYDISLCVANTLIYTIELSCVFLQILDATKALLTESAHKAMSDPEILDHSMEFATDVSTSLLLKPCCCIVADHD